MLAMNRSFVSTPVPQAGPAVTFEANVSGLAIVVDCPSTPTCTATLFSLKSIERDLLNIGVDPRSLLGIAFRRQADIDEKIRAEFPQWPADPPLRRVFEGVCEVLFPNEGLDANVPTALRIKHAMEVIARARPSVFEQWGSKTEKPKTALA